MLLVGWAHQSLMAQLLIARVVMARAVNRDIERGVYEDELYDQQQREWVEVVGMEVVAAVKVGLVGEVMVLTVKLVQAIGMERGVDHPWRG